MPHPVYPVDPVKNTPSTQLTRQARLSMSDSNPTTERHGPYTITSRSEVYQNPWIRVHEDCVSHDNGSQGLFGIVTMQAGSTVLAIDDQRQAYFVDEFKYAYGQTSLELVSGGIDQDEIPLAAAKRELGEELGLIAENWISLGVINPFTTVIDSPNHMFIATKLRPVQRRPDAFEELQIRTIPLETAQQMAFDGKIAHAASVICLLKSKWLEL